MNRPYNVFFISVGANFVRPLFVCGNRSFSGRRGRRPLQDTNIGIASALSLNCYSFVRKFLKGGAGGNEIFRLRNISVATERCDVFLQKVPPCNLLKNHSNSTGTPSSAERKAAKMILRSVRICSQVTSCSHPVRMALTK